MRTFLNWKLTQDYLFFLSFQAKDIFKIHEATCKNFEKKLQISSDGMSESKSTNVSIDVYSTRMQNCKVVYPHKLVKPLGKYKIDNSLQFTNFIKDIIDNDGIIEQYIADNLKRATGKGCLNHASTFPCEYCFARGVRYEATVDTNKAKEHLEALRKRIKETCTSSKYINEIEKELLQAEKELKPKKRSHIVWPSSTRKSEPRTTEKILQIANEIEERGTIPPDEAKGVVSKSPLFMIDRFNFVLDSPAEYLHAVCIGVTKRLIELTFAVGDNRKRITKRKLSSPVTLNKLLRGVKLPRECSRRIRELDFSVLKGQEFRNFTLFLFPLIIECIEENAKERKLWLQFSYMIRSCILPNKEFKQIDLDFVEQTCENFYVLYEKLFGSYNCSYNTHIVSSHLMEMRVHGPLTMTSAFGFEAFYGEIRNSFVPGTQSTLKQVLKKILLKRILNHHCCKNTLYYSSKDTCLESNSLIYCYQDSTHKMYKINHVGDDFVICNRIGKYEQIFQELPGVKWSVVGVYRKGPISSENVTILKKNIAGKIMQVQNLLITCPENVLQEQ